MPFTSVHHRDPHTEVIARNTKKGWDYWILFGIQVLTLLISTAGLLIGIAALRHGT